jgi:hypothetical protein
VQSLDLIQLINFPLDNKINRSRALEQKILRPFILHNLQIGIRVSNSIHNKPKFQKMHLALSEDQFRSFILFAVIDEYKIGSDHL